jgi:hypothetical protein
MGEVYPAAPGSVPLMDERGEVHCESKSQQGSVSDHRARALIFTATGCESRKSHRLSTSASGEDGVRDRLRGRGVLPETEGVQELVNDHGVGEGAAALGR